MLFREYLAARCFPEAFEDIYFLRTRQVGIDVIVDAVFLKENSAVR